MCRCLGFIVCKKTAVVERTQVTLTASVDTVRASTNNTSQQRAEIAVDGGVVGCCVVVLSSDFE